MKLKRIITLLLVLSLMLTLLSSCAETGDGLQAETTENDTKTPETTGSNSNDTEKPEDTTGGTPETTIPEGVDIELYNATKEALIQLDDETKKEIEKALELKQSTSSWWAEIDEATYRFFEGIRCFGSFENCIVIHMVGIATAETSRVVAGYEFHDGTVSMLYGYCNGVMYELEKAYEKGYISKEEVGLVHERHKIVKKYIRTVY